MTLVDNLQRRIARAPGSPLVTWYDLERGHRIELSAKTFGNWCDKSVNLLTSVDVDENPEVLLKLLTTDPLHWVTLVWAAAVWQLGGTIWTMDAAAEAPDVDAAIIGPDNPRPIPGAETIACSLHPLGQGFDHRLEAVTDFAEALGQADAHWSVPGEGLCFSNGNEITWDQANAVTASDQRRVITQVTDPWQYLVDALLAPLAGDGSTVLVQGHPKTDQLAESDQLARIIAQEKAVWP